MPQRFLSIKNFEKYQHYGQRNPPWIKLYKSLLTDRAFLKLSIMERYVYVCLLILASECDNKVINDPSYLAHRMDIAESDIDLKPLYRAGFLLASSASIRRYHRLETETETETEKKPPTPLAGGVWVDDGFEAFWNCYPRRVGKEAARKVWTKLKPDPDLQSVIVRAIAAHSTSAQWRKDNGQFIPHPATWLHQQRWLDDVQPVRATPKSLVELL